MKVILSRKGFDGQYGGYPSIIWPDKRMLSFPIPVESPEQGVSPDKMFFDDKSLLEIFKELGFKKNPSLPVSTLIQVRLYGNSRLRLIHPESL